MKTTLFAKSSSGEPYNVEFAAAGNCITVFCQCKAGQAQMVCKHRIALIQGDASMLNDPSQASLLAEMQQWAQYAMLRARTARYVKELKEFEVRQTELAECGKALKSEMGRDLRYGNYEGRAI